MPIFADIAPGTTPVPPGRRPDWQRLEFCDLDGNSLITWSGTEWINRRGTVGLDAAPIDVPVKRVPGLDGARLGRPVTLPREVQLTVMIRARDGYSDTLRSQLARMRSLLNYRAVEDVTASEGTFDLIAATPAGRRYLRCQYLSGMEGNRTLDASAGPSWQTCVLRLLAVDPYWRGREWSTPVVSVPVVAPFLSSDPADVWPRQLASTVALGQDMPVRIGGDTKTPPVVQVVGPATTTHVSSPQGLDVHVGAIGAGQTLLIDAGRSPGRRRRVLLNGARAGALVVGSPRWKPLPPGDALISVEVTGASSATSARVYGTELWETHA